MAAAALASCSALPAFTADGAYWTQMLYLHIEILDTLAQLCAIRNGRFKRPLRQLCADPCRRLTKLNMQS
jgi:hypothetical protein